MLKNIFIICWPLLAGCASLRTGENGEGKKIMFSGFAQGTSWHTLYYATDTMALKTAIDSIFKAIDSSLSLYKSYSTIVSFNQDKRGIVADVHLRRVVKASLEVHKQTYGLSDITVWPLVQAWGFGASPDGNIPTDSAIRSIMPCIGLSNILLRGDSLIKLKPCVQIDVNGIAQGYTVDVIADFFERCGITDYLVEVGGELKVHGGKQPGSLPFKVGIEAPAQDKFGLSPVQRTVELRSGALTTSGNYRKYYENGDRRISHIIDPRTGYPVQNEMISVTVYAKDAITADAYDNALMAMPLDSALAFVEKKKDLAAFFIYRRADGSVADTASRRFRKIAGK